MVGSRSGGKVIAQFARSAHDSHAAPALADIRFTDYGVVCGLEHPVRRDHGVARNPRQVRQDLRFGLPPKPAPGNPGIGQSENSEGTVAQRQPQPPGRQRQVGHPDRPEFPPRQPAPGNSRQNNQQAQRHSGPVQGQARTEKDGGRDQRGCPQGRRQQEVERECRERGLEQARGQIGRQPESGREAAGQDDACAAGADPGRSLIQAVGRNKAPGDRAAQETARKVQQQIACADAGQTGQGAGEETELSVRDQGAGRGAGEILAGKGGEREQ